ncbi:phosphonate ABC transporter ATP-binding protein [Hwanghaeella sp.]|uniref:phosphonate ABC transporter ATP-binding protein n=1 Tax=Hwanghaeella sp. TaxID=2605943 RepID=UPI003CCBE340
MPETIATSRSRPGSAVETNKPGVERRFTPAPAVSAVPEDQPATVCSVRRLVKRFGGRSSPAILRGVSLDVADGQAVAILGSNGAGKSTLLRCLPRLIEPNDGTISLLDEEVVTLKRTALRRLRSRIGFVFQRHNLSTRLSVLSNVIHGAHGRAGPIRASHQSLAPKELRQEAMHCLDQVRLADFAERRAGHLSGGQSQRVAIARALMQRPEIMIADEPVASLDPSAAEDVMELFARLMRENGITLIFTSHHLNHALTYGDRIIALKDGLVAEDRPTARLQEQDLDWIYDGARQD